MLKRCVEENQKWRRRRHGRVKSKLILLRVRQTLVDSMTDSGETNVKNDFRDCGYGCLPAAILLPSATDDTGYGRKTNNI